MITRKLLAFLLVLTISTTQAQTNFSYSPKDPKPGDVITFTYEPAGDIANTILPVEGTLHQVGLKGRKADDIMLERIAGKYTGKFTADPSMNFIYLAFTSDKKFDNNFNAGYTIQLNENNKPRIGSSASKSLFYQGLGAQTAGVEVNNEKAFAAIEKEFELYPESRKANTTTYIRLQTLLNKQDAVKIVLKEIENMLKAGLKEESDYTTLEGLYNLAKLPEQSKLINTIKLEKFPEGQAALLARAAKITSEKDLEKKRQMVTELLQKAQSGGDNYQIIRERADNYKAIIPNAYIANKDWVNVKKSVSEAGFTDKSRVAMLYNSAAWEMQKNGENLLLAEEFARTATEYYKNLLKDPTAKKPDGITQKQWVQNTDNMFAQYADTYGMVLYRMGNYKKGFEYAKAAAITINKGKDPEVNNTYALLAEKVLPKKQFIKDVEQFVKDGKVTTETKDLLKNAYVKDKKSDAGFDTYYAGLQKEAYLKMVEELRKSMLNTTAASFALLDLDGKKVQLADLKGKVVIVDFWATWCGPCKASFPGMQKMVNKYKDDPNVKFVFIDTWERGENKKKDAQEFITKNKYTFHVLQDNDDKVVADYKVSGIPTKFVIDKNGMLRFKAIGFDGSDEKLMQELTAMIEMASDANNDKALK